MTGRTLVKITAMEHCILFRTVAHTQKSPRTFYIVREAITELRDKEEVTQCDGHSFATLRRNDAAGTMSIQFTWLSGSKRRVAGRMETVTIPYEKLLDFMERSAQPNGPKGWNVLSMETDRRPRLEFCGKENLHAVVANPTVRKKLVRFLRDNFHWKGVDKICFYNDFVEYSFFFREFSNGQPGMCGGLIFHMRENLDKAYYATHT